ncbi:MAG TPA: RdgB/HAM1 family non-canonical purine NTP pyrophosphatase [Candidatus Scatomorpha merdigallinarum]|nr:RdgB/HAM1 family non-canonical purine NTP pyrophosphatase [Candidatus Scatomorpha merdigallinarum]
MRLILASNNAHKAQEFREILSPLGIDVVTQSEAGCHFEADETGETFEENAFIKAEAAMKATGEAAVSDDSGLEVDALGGEPGVRSARYTGRHEDSDADRRAYLMKKLSGVEHRTARFVSAICCVFPNGDRIEARGECEGAIATYEAGENGFGYDAMFIPEGENRTMAQMSAEEKNAISHRGRALRKFARLLEEYTNAHK